MWNGVWSAAGGMRIESRRLEIIANNLANVSTTGYKRDVPFIQTFNEALESRGTASPRLTSHVSLQEGAMKVTGNPLDIAIEGEGFLELSGAGGNRYVKSASFTLSPDGRMLLPDGSALNGRGGPVMIDGNEVSITSEGRVIVDGSEQDTLRVVAPGEAGRLVRSGNNLFMMRGEAREGREELFKVRQGYLESSNVDVVQEMINMIEASKAFEAYEKTLSTIMNDVNYKTVNIIGKISQ